MTGQLFSAAEVDRAVDVLAADPGRFAHAQEIVTHAAPGLHRILGEAMRAGGWHESGAAQAREVAGLADDGERALAVQTLAAEEARLGMLVGVAVGIELCRELEQPTSTQGESP
ncbi:MAG: hypothetical protein V9E83_11575 [Baekduia sp.]